MQRRLQWAWGHMLISPPETRDQEFKSSVGCTQNALKSQTKPDVVGCAYDPSPREGRLEDQELKVV